LKKDWRGLGPYSKDILKKEIQLCTKTFERRRRADNYLKKQKRKQKRSN